MEIPFMKKIIEFIIMKLRNDKDNAPKNSFCSKNSKKFFTRDDSLSIEFKQNLIKENINNEAKEILKEAVNNPEILVNFINSKGTYVIKSCFMKNILFSLGEEEGFLLPMQGFKALFFVLLVNTFSETKLKIGLKTPALFAFGDKPLNIYFLSHQFHMWLSYINELPGFSETTRQNFKNIWSSNVDTQEVRKLSMEEILSLKDVIARDLEAINFVKEMAREFIGQKQALEKIKQGKSVNI